MSKYKQTDITGESYIRFDQAVIKNPLNKNPSITFTEEQVMNIDGEEIHRAVSNVSETLKLYSEHQNLDEVVPLVNPITSEPIEGASMTYEQIMTGIFSLYYHLADKRDNESI